MTVELTTQEAQVIMQLLNTPVTIPPAAMTEYKTLIDGIVAKLSPKKEGE